MLWLLSHKWANLVTRLSLETWSSWRSTTSFIITNRDWSICTMWDPSANVHLAILAFKLCIFFLPPAVLSIILTSVDKTNSTTHRSVSVRGWKRQQRLQMPSQKPLLTLLLTQTFLIQEATPSAPMCSQFPYLLGYFSLSPCFCLLTSSTSNDHHSLGHPKLSWIGALAELHLLVSQLMGSWQHFSLYKDRIQAALWCCQTMTSTGLPADFFALSPWE